MIDTKYLVTKEPEIDGVHFVHTEDCQVLPEQEMVALGTFDSCEAAVTQARNDHAPLNACALCCPDCYVKDEEKEGETAA